MVDKLPNGAEKYKFMVLTDRLGKRNGFQHVHIYYPDYFDSPCRGFWYASRYRDLLDFASILRRRPG